MRPAAGPEPVAEPEEVFLVDGIQHSSGRSMDDFVLKGSDRKRALPPVRRSFADDRLLADFDPLGKFGSVSR